MNWVIETEELTKKYGSITAVDNLSIQIPTGEVTALLGANGAGKTTTIKLLLGITRPTSGSARVLGMDPWKQGQELRRLVGYLPEVPETYGFMTLENLFDFNRGLYQESWNQNLVDHYCQKFNLPRQQKLSRLSRGMKNKAALVMALAAEPQVLFLDEPTAGLDIPGRYEFLGAVMDEVIGSGRTVLFSSHLLEDVRRVADNVAMLKDGKLLFHRPLDQLMETEKKVRVVFQKDVSEEELSNLPGVAKAVKEGRSVLITVSGDVAEVIRALEPYPRFALEIIEQSLEEIFFSHIAGEGESHV